MRHEIPSGNWHIHLADAIRKASDGDVIVCLSEAMKELGEAAVEDMCPEKKLIFVVEPREPNLYGPLPGRPDGQEK